MRGQAGKVRGGPKLKRDRRPGLAEIRSAHQRSIEGEKKKRPGEQGGKERGLRAGGQRIERKNKGERDSLFSNCNREKLGKEVNRERNKGG